MSATAADFTGTERFEIRRCLGAGGMGVVYEAYDRERHTQVALKTLRLGDATQLYHFKNEFRALADVNHPNLAALHELVRAGDQWFFTMELVSGRDFLSWVRPGPAPGALDVEHLRGALEQLAEGIEALHLAGKLHRDLKPSNVLVTEEGRVVVLDFGLVADFGPQPAREGGTPAPWGTPDYMAPEQSTSAPLGPAVDWYAYGVMLYQALAGRLPYSGTYLEVLLDKQHHDPQPPRQLAPALPGDLDELCMELLRRDPATRPSGDQVLKRVGSVTGQRALVLAPAAPSANVALVGRDRHLDELERALVQVRSGRAVTVLVEGASGMGKTALVRAFVDKHARAHDSVVLAGRCWERESVPYKALDSLIDALTRHLMHLPRLDVEALLPRDVLALARVFPVLQRVEAVLDRPRRSLAIPDPRELRRVAFSALRELLARLADTAALVLHIDDLQWGDADSAALLADLLRPPDPPALLLIASYRAEDAGSSEVLRAIDRGELLLGADVRRLQVGPLTDGEAAALALALLDAEQPDAGSRAAAIVRESRGHPYLVGELCRHLRGEGGRPSGELGLDAVLDARVRRFPADARRLLEIVCVASRPISQTIAFRAAGLSGDQLVPLGLLRAGHLVRTRGPRDRDLVEPYHDRIRELVLSRLPAEQLRELHRRLAVSLEAWGHADPDALAVHFRGAGLRDRAAEWAVKAAARAETALAFDRAAALYRTGVEEVPGTAAETAALRRKLGEALANAGRGRDAAEELLAAAKGAPAGERLERQRLAAEQLLQSGHIDDGLAVIGTVLRALHLRLAATPRQAVTSLMWGRARVRLRGLEFTPRDPSQIPAAELSRIDIHWALASALGLVDTVRGADFQTRHLLLALRAGEPYRVVRALSAEVAYNAVAGAAGRARAAHILTLAQTTLARVEEPHALALHTWSEGVLAFMEGRWQDAFEKFEHAEAVLRDRCTRIAWELGMARSFSLWALFYRGELADIVERVPAGLKEARARGDRFTINGLSSGWANLAWLCVGDVDGARRVLDEAMRDWSYQGFHLQHYLELLAKGSIDLYVGDAAAAWARIEDSWPRLQASYQLEVQHNRLEMLFLRARSALAAALADAGPRDKLLRQVERDARTLEHEDLAWPRALAALCRGGLAAARADSATAARELEQALAAFEQLKMPLYAAVARRRLGQVVGGEPGAYLVAVANQYFAAQKVEDAARFTAIWAPG